MSSNTPSSNRIDSLVEKTALSEQEANVLAREELGWSNSEIADDLDLAVNTVREYERRVDEKVRQAKMTEQAIASASESVEIGSPHAGLYLAPCADSHAQRHFQDTVVEGVRVSAHSDLIPERHQEMERLPIWGTGEGNASAGEDMEPGDIVAFYVGERTYSHIATVRAVERNVELAEAIWTPRESDDGESETWPYVMYLDDLTEVNLDSRRLHSALEYGIEYPLGFTQVDEGRVQQIRHEYGSLDDYFEVTLARAAVEAGEELPVDMYQGEDEEETFPDEEESLEELRQAAEEGGGEQVASTTSEQTQYHRSEAVKKYARKRADGVCEGCGDPAPFRSKTGKPYLEVHHVLEVSDEGPDRPDAVVALCPNCHTRTHYSEDANEWNEELIDRLRDLEDFGE